MIKKSYHSLDILKFILAIAVVSIHTEPLIFCNNEVIVRLYEVIVRCAVPLFFMMTGFFLVEPMKIKYQYIKIGGDYT